ncbi:hypothetical protein H920_17136 [Fukomys damarensis]|uniref:Uncharacterized protein n=1 Tax=Fukomys damarensis TaxID=885580 RepID=A0A091CUX8_FUKDA|nr:hypothetical protein H920_17136 [Fukomys damarensis]
MAAAPPGARSSPLPFDLVCEQGPSLPSPPMEDPRPTLAPHRSRKRRYQREHCRPTFQKSPAAWRSSHSSQKGEQHPQQHPCQRSEEQLIQHSAMPLPHRLGSEPSCWQLCHMGPCRAVWLKARAPHCARGRVAVLPGAGQLLCRPPSEWTVLLRNCPGVSVPPCLLAQEGPDVMNRALPLPDSALEITVCSGSHGFCLLFWS